MKEMAPADELSIDHTPYIIGSELDCDGVIPSGTVSRHHARITKKGGLLYRGS